jgi:hypothetical protein
MMDSCLCLLLLYSTVEKEEEELDLTMPGEDRFGFDPLKETRCARLEVEPEREAVRGRFTDDE